jgi:hypothetical protein
MAAAVACGPHRAPRDGDSSMCAGCGCLFIRQASAWRKATAADVGHLSPQQFIAITLTAMAIILRNAAKPATIH